ncbi:aldo/keto reductase [Bacillus salitolerans]|uniref:Aldo/keto reductase n=1 Tax=Bacillus salitolerans TaxID=1437434 RepID=A0ABW4LR71_9BACI
MISGYATYKDTVNYLDRNRIVNSETEWFSFSPIAIGTHLGNMDETDSRLYQTSIEYGLKNGINYIDTAINYRGMRSERDLGVVLSRLINEKKLIKRSEIVISSKAGLIPGDIDAKLIPTEYLQKILLEGGIIKQSDLNIVEHHRHVLVPSYYEFAIEKSKMHLGLDTIDIYYIHNPEISLKVVGPEVFYEKLKMLFISFEEQVSKGNIQYYGLATWSGLLCNPSEAGYISLEKVVNVLKEAIGDDHHFKFIQCPYNSYMDEAKTRKNQEVNRESYSVLEAAQKLGLTVVTSAPFNLGKLIHEGENPYKILLSILHDPFIHSVMVGMKNVEHVIKNMELIRKSSSPIE